MVKFDLHLLQQVTLKSSPLIIGQTSFLGDVLLPAIPILLSDIVCMGNESTLLKCSYGEFGDHDCSHNKDIVVHCTCKFFCTLLFHDKKICHKLYDAFQHENVMTEMFV